MTYKAWENFASFKTDECIKNHVFYILPHHEGYTIRRVLTGSSAAYDPEHLRGCTTTGRGNVIGTRHFNILACGVPNNADSWEMAGDPDQIFSIHMVGRGPLFEIRPNNIEGDCISIARNSIDKEAAIISWACNGEAGQRFEIKLIKEIEPLLEAKLLERHGWIKGPDSWQLISPAGGVDMPGGNYNEFETIDDNGKYCALACVQNGISCKGFTWTAAGFDRSKPMCQLKSTLTQPINRGPSSTNDIFSGIVRR
ncbi:PAN domain-containing protein [Sphingorhabdus lutea]|nr:PAN domain-containing protein [Sphingorhabdus lutea]